MKRILVPTDFSAYADKALQYAVQIAGKNGAEIMLLHICSLPVPVYEESEADIAAFNREKTIELNAQLRRYKTSFEESDGVKIRTLLSQGDTVETIVHKINEFKIDLVVMGTRGASGIKAMVLGTRTAAVMKATKVPVLAVPENYDGAPPKNILLAIQREESDQLLGPLFEISSIFGARVRTAIFTEDDAPVAELIEHAHTAAVASERLQQIYTAPNLEVEHIAGDNFREAIDNYIQSKKVDLLVMVSHRRNLLQRLFGSSMTRKMAYHTHIPLLALHE